jgi:hypothetical protein
MEGSPAPKAGRGAAARAAQGVNCSSGFIENIILHSGAVHQNKLSCPCEFLDASLEIGFHNILNP